MESNISRSEGSTQRQSHMTSTSTLIQKGQCTGQHEEKNGEISSSSEDEETRDDRHADSFIIEAEETEDEDAKKWNEEDNRCNQTCEKADTSKQVEQLEKAEQAAHRQRQFCSLELLLLSEAWINASENKEKGMHFWEAVYHNYSKLRKEMESRLPVNNNQVFLPERTRSSLQAQWSRKVFHVIKKFEDIARENPRPLGLDEDEWFMNIDTIFVERHLHKYGKSFEMLQLKESWLYLREQPKFIAEIEGKNQKKIKPDGDSEDGLRPPPKSKKRRFDKANVESRIERFGQKPDNLTQKQGNKRKAKITAFSRNNTRIDPKILESRMKEVARHFKSFKKEKSNNTFLFAKNNDCVSDTDSNPKEILNKALLEKAYSTEQQDPANEQQSLVDEKQNSGNEKQNSGNEKQNSANEKQNSANGQQNSANEQQNSANGQQNSANGQQIQKTVWSRRLKKLKRYSRTPSLEYNKNSDDSISSQDDDKNNHSDQEILCLERSKWAAKKKLIDAQTRKALIEEKQLNLAYQVELIESYDKLKRKGIPDSVIMRMVPDMRPILDNSADDNYAKRPPTLAESAAENLVRGPLNKKRRLKKNNLTIDIDSSSESEAKAEAYS